MSRKRSEIASLPMYDLPELRAAHGAFWAALAVELRHAGIDGVPRALTRSGTHGAAWRETGLLFSQCCGYDLIKRFARELQPVAAPRYRAPDCTGHDYCSFVVVREDADFQNIAGLRGHTFALNGRESHSGMNAMRAALAPLANEGRFFASVITTGAHDKSLQAVARGAADAAAIDCVTHALLARHRPSALSATRVLAKTSAAPALPFVTRIERSSKEVELIETAVRRTIVLPAMADVCADLLLEGVDRLSAEAYAPIGAMEEFAVTAGYPVLT